MQKSKGRKIKKREKESNKNKKRNIDWKEKIEEKFNQIKLLNNQKQETCYLKLKKINLLIMRRMLF